MRIALAGYAWARQLHARQIPAAGGEIVAVATSNPDRAAQVREDLPGARVVDDLDALLAAAPELGVDAVVLATPTGAHAAHARAVIAAGLPFVVDKPVSVDAETTEQVVAAAAATKVPMTVYHNRRWDSGPRALAAAVARGDLGEVRRFEMRFERWRPEPKHRWREDTPWQQGGGTLLDLGPHVVDTAVQVLGPVASVDATVDHVTTPADDDVILFLRHAGGGVSLLTCGSVAPSPGPRLRVTGTTAGYLFDDEDEPSIYPDLASAPGAAGWIVQGDVRRPAPLPDGPGQSQFYVEFLAALGLDGYEARQAAMPVQPADAVHTARVLDAARRSAATGQAVPL